MDKMKQNRSLSVSWEEMHNRHFWNYTVDGTPDVTGGGTDNKVQMYGQTERMDMQTSW